MGKATHREMALQGTQADFKNELLYKSFGINYNQLPARFRKVCHVSVCGAC